MTDEQTASINYGDRVLCNECREDVTTIVVTNNVQHNEPCGHHAGTTVYRP